MKFSFTPLRLTGLIAGALFTGFEIAITVVSAMHGDVNWIAVSGTLIMGLFTGQMIYISRVRDNS